MGAERRVQHRDGANTKIPINELQTRQTDDVINPPQSAPPAGICDSVSRKPLSALLINSHGASPVGDVADYPHKPKHCQSDPRRGRALRR